MLLPSLAHLLVRRCPWQDRLRRPLLDLYIPSRRSRMATSCWLMSLRRSKSPRLHRLLGLLRELILRPDPRLLRPCPPVRPTRLMVNGSYRQCRVLTLAVSKICRCPVSGQRTRRATPQLLLKDPHRRLRLHLHLAEDTLSAPHRHQRYTSQPTS